MKGKHVLLYLLPVLLILVIVAVVNLGRPMTISSLSTPTIYQQYDYWTGTWDELYSRKLSTPQGNTLTFREVLNQSNVYRFPDDLSVEKSLGKVYLENSSLLEVQLFEVTSHRVNFARTGIFVWNKANYPTSRLEVRIDTGEELLRLAFYGEDEPLDKLAERARVTHTEFMNVARNQKIPTGLYPPITALPAYIRRGVMGIWSFGFSPLWLVFPGYILWIFRRIVVFQTSGDKLHLIQRFTGELSAIGKKQITIPGHSYTSPPLSELLQGAKLPQQLEIEAYLVEKASIKEARVGPMVWHRSKDIKGQLLLVVKGDGRHFAFSEKPEVFRHKDADYDVEDEILKKAAKCRLRLIPIGINWN